VRQKFDFGWRGLKWLGSKEPAIGWPAAGGIEGGEVGFL